MEIAPLIQERDIHVAEQVTAHAAVLVARQGGTQREAVNVVDLTRHKLNALHLLGIFQ